MHFCDLKGLCAFFGNFRAQNVILEEKMVKIIIL